MIVLLRARKLAIDQDGPQLEPSEEHFESAPEGFELAMRPDEWFGLLVFRLDVPSGSRWAGWRGSRGGARLGGDGDGPDQSSIEGRRRRQEGIDVVDVVDVSMMDLCWLEELVVKVYYLVG